MQTNIQPPAKVAKEPHLRKAFFQNIKKLRELKSQGISKKEAMHKSRLARSFVKKWWDKVEYKIND